VTSAVDINTITGDVFTKAINVTCLRQRNIGNPRDRNRGVHLSPRLVGDWLWCLVVLGRFCLLLVLVFCDLSFSATVVMTRAA